MASGNEEVKTVENMASEDEEVEKVENMASEEEEVTADSLDFQEVQKEVENEIEEAIKDLAQYLLTKFGDKFSQQEAEETAKGVLLKGRKMAYNAGDGESPIDPTKYKYIICFLVIIAPRAAKDSHKRSPEVHQRASEARNFLTTKFKLEGEGTSLQDEQFEGFFSTFRVVDSYDDMKREVQDFVREKMATCKKPFVLFLGHGTPTGSLCFADRNHVHASTVLDDITTISTQNKTYWQRFQELIRWKETQRLRIVLPQCYGHLIDCLNKVGEIQKSGKHVDYIYVSSKRNPETISEVILPTSVPIVEKLVRFKYASDITLDLLPAHPIMDERARELQGLDAFRQVDRGTIGLYLLEGPPTTMSPTMQQAVQEKRENMKRFLCLNYSQSSSATAVCILDGLMEPLFRVNVNSASPTDVGTIRGAITSFLSDLAADVPMPVILVRGTGKVENNELQLVLNDGSCVRADSIYEHYKETGDIKMVFCCHEDDRKDQAVMFSNALPLPVKGSQLRELMIYASVILTI